MQTSQSNDFEVINIFNTLTLEALSRCRVNDAWRPFNIIEVLITKSLVMSNLGISQESTPTIYYMCSSHGMWVSHFSCERLLVSGLLEDLLKQWISCLNSVKIIKSNFYIGIYNFVTFPSRSSLSLPLFLPFPLSLFLLLTPCPPLQGACVCMCVFMYT